MESPSPLRLATRDGIQGTLAADFPPLDREDRVPVLFANGERLAVPAALLREALAQTPDHRPPILPLSFAELHGLDRALSGEVQVIPVVEEQPVWHKRTVETGRVRIVKQVAAQTQDIDTAVWQETLQVERVAVNQPVDGPVSIRYEGDTLVVPVLEEVLVVEKRLMLKEELRIAKHRVESRQPRQVTLRREEVTVERLPAGMAAETAHPGGG